MAVTVTTAGFEVWNYSLVDGYKHLKATCCLHLKGFKSIGSGTNMWTDGWSKPPARLLFMYLKQWTQNMDIEMYLGAQSRPFFPLRAFRASLCFSSRRVFSAAAPSMSPSSSFRISGRSLQHQCQNTTSRSASLTKKISVCTQKQFSYLQSVGHSLLFIPCSISLRDMANSVNW